MKIFITVLITILYTQQSFSVIFGVDDRVEITDAPKLDKLVSPSVALQVSPVFLKTKNNLDFEIDFPSISNSTEISLCPDQRFSGQPTASINCSGFLVGPDLIMTAGHCMIGLDRKARQSTTPFCKDFKWVFDYKYDKNGNLDPTIKKENIFSCAEVLYANFSYKIPRFKNRPANPARIYGEDIALIRLDRPTKRDFLSLSPVLISGTKVSMVGHPNGLPQKATLNGRIRTSIHKHYVTADLDSFDGNSGSPIIDSNFESVGVLARTFPSEDYKYIKERECAVVNKCNSSLSSCLVEDSPPNNKSESYAHIQRLSKEILELINSNSLLIF